MTDITPGYTPGSDAAVLDGCTCPVIDNGHGRGYMGIEGTYVMAEDCPLHKPTEAVNWQADTDDLWQETDEAALR